jgi:hypothetical protein
VPKHIKKNPSPAVLSVIWLGSFLATLALSAIAQDSSQRSPGTPSAVKLDPYKSSAAGTQGSGLAAAVGISFLQGGEDVKAAPPLNGPETPVVGPTVTPITRPGCFDLAVLREVPADKLPKECGGPGPN